MWFSIFFYTYVFFQQMYKGQGQIIKWKFWMSGKKGSISRNIARHVCIDQIFQWLSYLYLPIFNNEHWLKFRSPKCQGQSSKTTFKDT